jgi:valyl-tRNA synthetase
MTVERRTEEAGHRASLPARYDPERVEAKWQAYWLTPDVYAAAYHFRKDDETCPVFVIDTPPPFTSGKLHMGHAYWSILNDTIARFKRMRGYNVLLPQGWDCQGLPTELKVQDTWQVSKDDKELFRQRCVEWTEQMIASMKQAMIRLGYRPDWEQFEYRTMDSSYTRIVQSTLLRFFDEGLIYRDLFPVHWCPHCETALAQAELGYLEARGSLYYIRFPYEGGAVEVATTRPELLSACQALAVHPADARYALLVGMQVEVPLFPRRVPVLVDESVDPDFGTGVVMICTFGDEQDIKWQQKYGLPVARVIDARGVLVNSGRYSGLPVADARVRVAHDLEAGGHLSKQEAITHQVLCHTDRQDCLSPIEFLVKDQFFIKTKVFKDEVIAACADMRWQPAHLFQRLVDWVNSIEWDWLISRQRLYGTPLPFWYCRDCNTVIPATMAQLPVDPAKAEKPRSTCPHCGSSAIEACEDVCDCWVDSSLTPLVISGYFEGADYFRVAYPASMRQQGHDIIRTWLYYTVLRCLLLTGIKPFQDVIINGHILGPDGYRMSKSRGNVVDPEEKIDEYGADAIRQALLSLTLGSDFSFNWDIVKYCKGFLQKYWSALRFAYRFISDYSPSPRHKAELTTMDKWVLAKLVDALRVVTASMEAFQFHTAIARIQNFFWHDFCDQYLEAVKHRLYARTAGGDFAAAQYALHTVLWSSTLALAPLCPHITEDLYHFVWLDEHHPTIHAFPWPDADAIPFDVEEKARGDIVVEALTSIRTEKARASIPLSQDVDAVTITASPPQLSVLRDKAEVIKSVLHIHQLRFEEGDALHASLLPS